MSTITNILIKNVETGILVSDEAYYNDLNNPVIIGARTGIKIIDGANENRIFGGRIQDAKLGIKINDVSNPQIYGTSVERFGIGIYIGPKAVSSPKILGSRLENKPKSGIGIRIAPTTLAAFIIGPYFQGLVADIKDYASDTNVIADKRWQVSSSTSVRGHYRLTTTVGQLQPNCKPTVVNRSSGFDKCCLAK